MDEDARQLDPLVSGSGAFLGVFSVIVDTLLIASDLHLRASGGTKQDQPSPPLCPLTAPANRNDRAACGRRLGGGTATPSSVRSETEAGRTVHHSGPLKASPVGAP